MIIDICLLCLYYSCNHELTLYSFSLCGSCGMGINIISVLDNMLIIISIIWCGVYVFHDRSYIPSVYLNQARQ